MGLLDKILGRGKKAAGDVTGDASLQTEGATQEHAGADEQQQQQRAAEAHVDREGT